MKATKAHQSYVAEKICLRCILHIINGIFNDIPKTPQTKMLYKSNNVILKALTDQKEEGEELYQYFMLMLYNIDLAQENQELTQQISEHAKGPEIQQSLNDKEFILACLATLNLE